MEHTPDDEIDPYKIYIKLQLTFFCLKNKQILIYLLFVSV